MKISIITVTYNSASTLEDTLNSILGQTYEDYEICLVDGGSKDETLQIVKNFEAKFNGRLRYISEPDNGIYDAMNKGIKMASGDIVGILNSDDFFFDNDVLSRIYKAFVKYKVDCIFGNLVYVNSIRTDRIERVWKGSEYREGCFKYGWVPAHPTFYVKRSDYIKYGTYNLSYQVSADFELMLRYLAKNKVTSKYIDTFFVRMRSGGESNGSIKNVLLGNKNILRAFNENNIDYSILYPFYRLIPKVLQRLKIAFLPSHKFRNIKNV